MLLVPSVFMVFGIQGHSLIWLVSADILKLIILAEFCLGPVLSFVILIQKLATLDS